MPVSVRRSLTALMVAVLPLVFAGQASAADDLERQATDLLSAYDKAFNAKDLDALGSLYVPEATIFEGGSIDRGWTAYRDHHLGPELKEMEGPRLSHADVRVVRLGSEAAYVTSEYRLQARMAGKDVDSGGLETLVLVKDARGRWQIRHAHTSSKRRTAPSPAPSPQ